MPAAAIALVGALVFGSADFLGGLSAKRLRSIVVTAVAAGSGLVLLVVLYPLLGGVWSLADVGWGALTGITGAIAIALLYACLAIGPMSILSPLTAIVSAIAPMLWGLLVDGEQLSAIGYTGLGIALVAVILVGFIPGEKVVRPAPRGLAMALGAGLAIGAFMIILDQTSPGSGIVPLIVNRGANALITASLVLMLLLLARSRGTAPSRVLAVQGPMLGATPTGHADLEHAVENPPAAPVVRVPASAWWLAIACGAVDAGANAIMLVALRMGDLSIVSALTAMYPAGTILLAAVVLRERIAGLQWVGLGLALAAGAMLAVS
ncbi:EamA family transporter [Microbacterium sp. SYP-A9085]|uniref:EamA family transporter n=1 Tax=Microbacterium sp. SYP-A9085 TaxID=2664454 RepID=UPI00129B000B|nr:EamA family transporter [Microbacterium sp. SYP-A9085]MRH29432.1 EamA family transporter [Microbacterium sp. SYP-A9085]